MTLATEGPAGPIRSGSTVPDEPDLGAPLFFVSHANVPAPANAARVQPPNRAFLQFFTDLSENLNHLRFRRSGADPGFMDLTMRGGKDWEREVLRAVGTCQVFVALLSNPYVNSPWCGIEWHAFTRRRCWNRRDQEWMDVNECVLPVIWAPLRKASAPACVTAVEWFNPAGSNDASIAALYQEQGLLGLLSTSRDAYTAVVWWLAREIDDKLEEFWVEPSVPKRAELANMFGAGEA